MAAGPQLRLLKEPPLFCEYAGGKCDQTFDDATQSEALFLYSNEPLIIASAIEEAVKKLHVATGGKRWLTWKDLGVTGQIIFCQICKALRHTNFVVADVTTLNFNLLFEIGFSIGLGIPVLPIRDTSLIRDGRLFSELGLIDTLGYFDFQNSGDIVQHIVKKGSPPLVLPQPQATDKEKPLYVMKSPFQSEGMVKLMSAVKKSGLRFRSFDPRETSRLSLHDAYKQVTSSLGVVVHLMSPDRAGAITHNARCAFVAGLALATNKRVLMLQEGQVSQPIDYRDIVRYYNSGKEIQELIIPLVKSVVEMLQETRFVPTSLALTLLEKVDMGDIAAENEIMALQSYFVPTGQYNDVKRGHARLVVGRKGAGKTAIFYGVREAHGHDRSKLVLDLKPEGHQLVKLREAILNDFSPGMQQYLLTAFWNYLLLMEIAHRIIRTEEKAAYSSPKMFTFYQDVRKAYSPHLNADADQGDFSERLLALVDDIVARRGSPQVDKVSAGEVTEMIHRSNIKDLNDAISQFLSISRKDELWLLLDNLDKGWPISDVKPEDVRIISSLLEATRKLQRQFDNRLLSLRAVVFLRNDIYQHLVLDPADRGKENPAILDWNDPETLKEMLRRRIVLSTQLDESFAELWRLFFVSHVRGEESFAYLLGRTLMRPRELLRFVRDCINVAVNRRHERVLEEDILHAEKSYSDDALVDLSLELKDVRPDFVNAPYAFIGSQTPLNPSDIGVALIKAGTSSQDVEKVRDLLLWFGFLGIYVYPDEERYSYQFEHNLQKMSSGLEHFTYCIHPAFRESLGCVSS
jgi:hypothetical protein